MSLDPFKIFKDYIKKFVLESQDLQKLIYYPYSDCLDRNDLENPYDLFNENTAMSGENGVHGVLLFKRQSDVIMNAEMPLVLVTFENATKSNSKIYDNIYIIFRIICKGSNIQSLENGDNRISSIYGSIDNNMNMASINGLGEIKKISYKELSINTENDAMMLIYRGFAFNSDISSNKNFKKRIFG